ncbi:hypothetical protein HF086_010979 [Spodoptera exigua]|uniref:Uncharacterized protein n=1 Tax=Spodoptera exigua TaxID=7107 RepID=A0A922MG16_SPOEX|nr:hypothetical protein HF086_010979 [Spodoptera exigua]
MIQKIVKAALEYVTQLPTDVDTIVNQIDQEINKISAVYSPSLSPEDIVVRQSVQPIDSTSTYETPQPQTRASLLLQYELPGEQVPHCVAALERLIAIAYKAYLELEHFPQCQEYLYKFASTNREDRPRGYLIKDKPNIKTLIAIILEELLKQRPIINISTNEDNRYGGFEVPNQDNYTPHITTPIPDWVSTLETLQINDYKYPQPQIITTTMPIKRQPVKPDHSEYITNLIIKLLHVGDLTNNRKIYEHITEIVDQNRNVFHPQLLNYIITLLKTHRQVQVPRLNDLLLTLLKVQRHPQLKDHYTDSLLTFLIPNHSGQYDARLVDILLYLINERPISEAEDIISILKPFSQGLPTTSDYAEIAFNIIKQIKNNLLTREQKNIILELLNPYLPDLHKHNNARAVIVAKELSKWNGRGIRPTYFNTILKILKPNLASNNDQRAVDIVYFLLTNGHRLSPTIIEFILDFLSPQNGIIDSRRLNLIHFILNEVIRSPKHGRLLLSLLKEKGPNILNSKYLETLLLLKHHNLINTELLDILVQLLNDETRGQVDDNQIRSLIYKLIPYKQHNPKAVIDIFTLLKDNGLQGNILELFQLPNDNGFFPDQEQQPAPIKVLDSTEIQMTPSGFTNDYRTPEGGYHMHGTEELSPNSPRPEQDLIQIFKWLDRHGLLNPDQTSNNEVVNKILKILQLGERELGVLELTYMLKHAKPLVYQPVYYVKYRLPILNFISNMKKLITANPDLNADPMRLLQELIVVSNVTEISPHLQGYPKEEILKLTLNDGDLVQAKILDEQSLNLNDQIAYVHTFNSDISPEELLQMNELNEAKYFPRFVQINDPSKLTILSKTIDKVVEFPPVVYKKLITTTHSGLIPEIPTVHQTFIERTNQQTTPQTVPETLVLPIK